MGHCKMKVGTPNAHSWRELTGVRQCPHKEVMVRRAEEAGTPQASPRSFREAFPGCSIPYSSLCAEALHPGVQPVLTKVGQSTQEPHSPSVGMSDILQMPCACPVSGRGDGV